MSRYWLFLLCLVVVQPLWSQEIRPEGFIGNQNPGIDVFWVSPFGTSSQFLFISRNTFSAPGYESEIGDFNTLNITAYQIRKTGIGVALATTATSSAALQARGGLQWLKMKPKQWLLYTILSSKLGTAPDVRWLTIAQISPHINEKLDGFTRFEWVTSVGFADTHRFSASLVRIGLQVKNWQFGPGANFLWTGRDFARQSANYGVFLTHVF